ncbi:MAG: response regulator, partial [Alphaproteobacteria bacterium]|nr:response regulator [Alphaproteobacteria bacterium]
MPAGPTRAKVLMIEDTVSLAETYREFLRAEPYDIAHVETGREGLAFLDRGLPDVVLLDLMLPDMDGIDILRRVAEQKMPVAVVVATAHGSINVAVEAMRLGAADFLVKPFNADRLVITLRNVLERQRLS